MSLIMFSCGMAKADSGFDTWGVTFSNSSEETTTRKTSKRKQETIRNVPVIGDGVKAVESIARGLEQGMASYYWQPQAVACGGRFNPSALTAAHKTLPCGSRVKVTNKRNGKAVTVTINDRGPFVPGRIIDLSKAAAIQIDMTGSGVVPVTVERF